MSIKMINFEGVITTIAANMNLYSTDDRESATLSSGVRGLLHRLEPSYIGCHRLIILLVYYIALVLLLSSNVLGISGAYFHFFSVSSLLLLVVSTLLMAGYLWGKMTIVTTLSLMTLATQISLSADTLYCAFAPVVAGNHMVIVINMLLLSGNTIVGLSTYLTRITQVNTTMMFVIYTICMLATNNATLIDNYFMLFVVLVFFSFLGFHIAKNARRLQVENTELRREEAELMQILRLNKNQIKAYVRLASDRHAAEHTRNLLDILGEASQKNLLANVAEYMRVSDTEKSRIDELFPELTASEKSICQLILRGKKLGDICSILGKTESNVNTQRAHIRRKLGLATADNLQEALEARMAGGADH